MTDERTNPKTEPEASFGSAGERVMDAALALKDSSRAAFMSDADKWVKRAQVVADALLSMKRSKQGRAALDEVFRPQRVDREEERNDAHLGSRVGVEHPTNPDATPTSQLGSAESSPGEDESVPRPVEVGGEEIPE